MKKLSAILLVLLVVCIAVPTFGAPRTRTVVFTVGSKTAFVDGERITLKAPPSIISGTTLLPIRVIQEQLLPDCSTINWNGDTREVTITDIPFDQLDCSYVTDILDEVSYLNEENRILKEKIAILERENDPLPEENTVPPIEYNKNGIVFTLKSLTKERGPMVDDEHTYHLRLNIKIKNLTESSCRFPADRTKMIIGDETFNQLNYDKTFINSIPGGAERSGWVRFPLKATKKTVKFKFVMWPSNSINHFDFYLKVDLDQAIPNSTHPSQK